MYVVHSPRGRCVLGEVHFLLANGNAFCGYKSTNKNVHSQEIVCFFQFDPVKTLVTTQVPYKCKAK